MIAPLDSTALGDLREALPQFAHLPLAHLHDLSSEHRLAYWLDEITQSLANESSIAFVSIVSGTINGFIVYNDSALGQRNNGTADRDSGAYCCRGRG